MLNKETFKEIFLVNITILEGRHYAWQNINSYVHIRVGTLKKVTKVRRNTDCPYYNEYFMFEFLTRFQDIFDKHITLTVFRARSTWRQKKILGSVTLDIATVWEQPDHQFYRKWAILNSPKSDLTGPRGYLKVTISILTKGQTPKIPLINPLDDDEIEGHLLLPEGITLERQKALYVFKIYKGMEIIKKSKNQQTLMENYGVEYEEYIKKRLPKSFVQITFAGLTAKTSTKKNTSFPIWNESLTVAELFPPLSQRIKVQLCYYHHFHKIVKTKKYLLINSIASDKVNGFLPTFGPAFVHFYKNSQSGDEYVGKILMSLETKLFSDIQTKTRCIIKDSIPPILESSVWGYENVILFVSILNVSVIAKKYNKKPISFEISWGRTKVIQNEKNDIVPIFETREYETATTDNHFWHINFDKIIPCLHMLGMYPNARRRFYNANLIWKLSDNVNYMLDEIEHLFIHDDFTTNSFKIETKLVELFKFVSLGCFDIIEFMEPTVKDCLTALDKEKIQMCLREMKDIRDICKTAYNPRMKKKAFRKAEKIFKRLDALVDHPQECWPDVFIWMKYGNKKISYLRLPAKKIVYSPFTAERGPYCGEITTFHFPSHVKSKAVPPSICKLDTFLWMGNDQHFAACLESLPKGYSVNAVDNQIENDNKIPTFLTITSSTLFSCRAHIYQGRFLLSYDRTGLSDFYARVIISDQSKRTKVCLTTLSPVWDQTLCFQDVTIYGNREQITSKPPMIIVEIMDQDKCCQVEYVGRCVIKPVIKFKDEPYARPNFPPKLQWWEVKNENSVVGEVLAVIELLEQPGDIVGMEVLTDVFAHIPNDIKPSLFDYRLEIIFWGLRDLKRVNALLITRPKIVIECGEMKLSSDTIGNTRFDLNFLNPLKYADIQLPNSEELVPPLSIKLFDCKTFGRCIYTGNHTVYVQKFMYHPISMEEWDIRMSGLGMKSYDSMISQQESVHIIEIPVKKYYDQEETKTKKQKCFLCCVKFCKWIFKKRKNDEIHFDESQPIIDDEDEDAIDWWTKYYASLETLNGTSSTTIIGKYQYFKLKIYDNELEKQPEFENFTDMLSKYRIFHGKTSGDEIMDERHAVGVLKCKIKMYLWPPAENINFVTPNGYFLQNGIFQGYPSNIQQSFTIRIYCVRGIKLAPKDANGKCDPFIIIRMTDTIIDDSKNYFAKTVNPIFGR